MTPRRTLRRPTEPLSGMGVRSGLDVTVRICPAVSGDGLVLHRTDLDRRVPLDLAHAIDLPSCSAVGTGPHDITLFVEHVMAVLWAYGVTDALVECSGPEIPLLDGSARLWDEAVTLAGLASIEAFVEPLQVTETVRVEDGEKWIEAVPAAGPRFTYDLLYENPLIGAEVASYEPGLQQRFSEDLAPARTFALVEELEQAQASGTLKAGSAANCRIVYDDHYSDPPTLPQEFARHKVLDMVGDLYLLGRPVIGDITAFRTGHSHNRALLRRLAELC